MGWRRIVGLVIHILIGAMLIMAGVAGLAGVGGEEAAAKMPFTTQQSQIIGVGSLLTGILLIVPRTSSLGLLLASGFWGGTICFHMARQEPYAIQSSLLLVTWAGGYLRNPALLGSLMRG